MTHSLTEVQHSVYIIYIGRVK